MKVAGFTFIRNAVKNDYPVAEAIQSILPLCDEFIVALGKSEDDTESLIMNIGSPKIKIVHTVWDDSIREGGAVFATETNKAYNAISLDTDWAFYIQGDECLHEKYLPVVKKAMADNLDNGKVEALLFKYLHFYGSYDFTASSRRWYRNEIRVVRFDKDVQSYKDAQGFRKAGRKLNALPIDACIYHYGWVKAPKSLGNKVRNFNNFYLDQPWARNEVPADYEFDYGNADRLVPFKEEHPEVIKKRIAAVNWKFKFDPSQLTQSMTFRRHVLQKLEDWTGWRVGEYKNYKKIKA
ncbi:glycosyltransferase family 2 protein [Paradesertivirga mongoliensis]|uniref:Glycosyltransferase family 2 protein n=1 Tax=Paradesertivirga mongoliensis TaxID=2100740 RepID=A0ABW4ZIR5_9SPHI|nr:glycosyltransferase family 2 protein [Pedobacter mongoliensis]